MSKGNQNVITRAEFLKIKQQLRTAGVTAVAKATNRSAASISKIKRAASYPKFVELNKGYQAVQAKHRDERKATKGEKAAPKVIVPVVKSSKVKVAVKTQADDKKLLDTLTKPDRRSKQDAHELLSLRTQVASLTTANELLNGANKSLNEQVEELINENVRLSMAKNRKMRSPLHRVTNALLRRKAGV